MDIATIIGVITAITLIMMTAEFDMSVFGDGASYMTVGGGGGGATMIANTLPQLTSLGKLYMKTIKAEVAAPTELIEMIVGFAETARREGILALESAVEEGADPFLGQGVRLAVDGTEPDLIMDILETELRFVEERHKQAQDILARMADTFPAFGMIGTLIGLVLMLRSMDDPSAIGPAMSLCLLTTLYGAILAQVLCAPFAAKLKTYSQQEVLTKQMIIEGIMSIQSGDNPRIVEHKLSVFLAPAMRPQSEEDAGE